MEKRRILGFLHYTTELGDGMRSAVVMDSCLGNCSHLCAPYRFVKEHSFGEDLLEKNQYSAKELVSYLKEEKLLCYTKPLGITILGKEPLADPLYCREVALGIRGLGMNLHLHTCLHCDQTAFDLLYGLVDLFCINFFTPIPGRHRPFKGYSYDRVRENLSYLDRKGFPYRLRVFVVKGVNDDSAVAIMQFVKALISMKSLILDFTHSGLNEEEKRRYRSVFLSEGIILY